jgi:hypothetical protein
MYKLGIAALAAGLSAAAACGPSTAACEELCDWWMGYCTAESKESCMEDCSETSAADVEYAQQQCLAHDASSCKGASCCLRFVYEDYYWQQNCL